MRSKSFFNTTRIIMIALFGSLAGVLHAFAKFPLPFAFPAFLEFDFSYIPIFIGTFALGPLSGCLIVAVKILLKLVCVGTSTMLIGDLTNLLVGIAFTVPAGILYRHFRSVKGAVMALAVGTASTVAVAVFANWLIAIPLYLRFMFNGSWEPLLGMMRPLFPAITQETFFSYYLLVSVLPFNLLMCLVASAVTFLVYKHISRLIDRINDRLSPRAEGEGVRARDIGAAAACIGVVALLLLFALLRFFLW